MDIVILSRNLVPGRNEVASGSESMENVTDSMKIEEIQGAEEGLRQLAEAMPQIVWATDPTGRLEYVNQHWHEYTGLEQAEREQFQQVVHPDDQRPFFVAWARALDTGIAFKVEFRLRRAADGAYRWFLAHAVPVRDSEGRIACWYGISMDIDDQKRAEEALVEVARRKDEFLAMLAHELRNPLAPLRNTLHILRIKGASDPVVTQMGGMMERQVEHLVRLVDDLLDVSRITRGQMELRKEPLDLAVVVSRAVQSIRPVMVERRHRLEVSLPPEPLPVLADPARLDQMLANLLTNAAKYTDSGGRIYLTVERRGNTVVTQVGDNGIGIRPEMLPHIFDLFQQADRVPGHVAEGLGIGLALVRSLVELHGGSVAAHSDGLGKGSSFVIRLPLFLQESPEVSPDLKIDMPATLRPLRILICDDNVDGALSLAMLLRLQGHTVVVTHDGPAALEVARVQRPEVILLDIGLPKGMDGYEVARQLRREDSLKDVLLCALTGYGQEEDRRRTQNAGFTMHLVKPVDPESLEEALAWAARRKPGPASG